PRHQYSGASTLSSTTSRPRATANTAQPAQPLGPTKAVDTAQEFAALPEVDLEPGDILIKKVFHAWREFIHKEKLNRETGKMERDLYAFPIRQMQKVAGGKYGSNSSEHFALAHCNPTPWDIIESDTNGVVCNLINKGDHIDEDFVVYRCKS